MRLNAEEFERRSHELFASSYLTSIGIIQSVALGILSLKFVEFGVSWVVALQFIGSFLALLLIAHEYSWWILLVRRTQGLPDTVVPYVLGLAEFWAMNEVSSVTIPTSRSTWFLALGLLGIVGMFSLWNNRSYCTDETDDVFVECAWLRDRAVRNLNIGIGIVGSGTVLLFWTWLYQKQLTDFWRVFVFLELFGLQIALLTISAKFMEKVRNEFRRPPWPASTN